MHQFFPTIVPETKITIVSKPYHELKFNHHDLYYNPHACIYLDYEKNASNAKTRSTEAKITIASQLYHHLKFNHHDIYYNPHTCIYLYYEKKMHQMHKQNRGNKHANMTTSTKKIYFS